MPLHRFDNLLADVLRGVHDFTSDATCAVTVALTDAAHPPRPADGTVADLAEISYANLSPRAVAGVAAERAGGGVRVTGGELVLAARGPVAPFRYVVLYNAAAPGGPLIGWYDYGEDVRLRAGETLTVDLSGGIVTLDGPEPAEE